MKRLLEIFCCFTLLSFTCCGKSNDKPFAPIDDLPKDTLDVSDCGKCLLITEQAEHSIRIINIEKNKTVWEWSAYTADDIEEADWFSNPDEVKSVYNNQYLLITASGGGIALIRIADKKAVFHAYVGGNPHSAAMLPDGNIVTASSTGNYLTLLHVDTLLSPDRVYKKKIHLPFAHNVVWDNKRQVLWSAGENKLYQYEYNFNCEQPDLILKDSLQLPGDEAHDLFPAYGEDYLWFTNTDGVYTINLENMEVKRVDTEFQKNIKSVSSGPEGFPTILMKPKTKWWSDEVIDINGNPIFKENGLKIYKARWFVHNLFSYPDKIGFQGCN